MPASRPAPPSSLSGVILWKAETTVRSNKEDPSRVVGADGRLANAVVTLVPLDRQDLSRIPPPQVPASALPQRGEERDESEEGATILLPLSSRLI